MLKVHPNFNCSYCLGTGGWSENGQEVTCYCVLNQLAREDTKYEIVGHAEKTMEQSDLASLIKMTLESVNDEHINLKNSQKHEIIQEAILHGYGLNVSITTIEKITATGE